MLARYTFRLVACICWWAALVVGTGAYSEQNHMVAALAWMLVIVLVSAGAAFWKGSEV